MSKSQLPRVWNIALNAWIIQDGNYPDFYVGQTAEFAVEFYQPPGTSVRSSALPISAVSVSDQVVGQTILHNEHITVLDIGILVYRDFARDCAAFGGLSVFEAEIQLGVDPYFYFENLSKLPDVPPLIYTWRIAEIF